jgi:methionyl-tRNA synthetase
MSLVNKNIGSIPAPGSLTASDESALQSSRESFAVVGGLLGRNQQKAALHEAMRVVADANKYLSDEAPWKLKDDPDRRESVLHVALQLISDAKTLLTPFLPHSSDKVFAMLGGEGVWSGQPELREVDDLDGGPSYPVLMGDYATQAKWESQPITPGAEIGPPVPLFAKLDPSVVEEELARLEQ